MNSPRTLSGVFVAAQEAGGKKGTCRPKARGREQISRTFCTSSDASSVYRGASPEPPQICPMSPQVQQRASRGEQPLALAGTTRHRRASPDRQSALLMACHRGPSPDSQGTRLSKHPMASPQARHRGASTERPRTCPKSPQMQRRASLACPPGGMSNFPGRTRPGQLCISAGLTERTLRTSIAPKPNAEAAKTIEAIGGALRAVQSALTTAKLAGDDCSPSPSPSEDGMSSLTTAKLAGGDCSPSPSPSEDGMSLCGTECTESTTCSSSLSSEDGCMEIRSFSSLRDARKTLKQRLGAQERSVRYARGLLLKLDELRDVVTEEDN